MIATILYALYVVLVFFTFGVFISAGFIKDETDYPHCVIAALIWPICLIVWLGYRTHQRFCHREKK